MNGKAPLQKQQKIDFVHYSRLIGDNKYWVILITVIFSALWFKVMPGFLAAEKKYNFSATIRFEDPHIRARVGNIDERLTMVETESRTKVVKTTRFLTQVIDSLQLNILPTTPGLSRSQIFAAIHLSKTPKYGSYTLEKKKNKEIALLYTNKREGKKDFLLQTMPLDRDSLLQFDANGIQVTVFTGIFKNRDELKFACIPNSYLVQSLRSKLKLTLNRRQTLFVISYEFHDPYLGPKIVNTIAHLFLKESLESKRFRTRNLLKSLTQQLQTSKQELEVADNALRRFRERNPHIYLTGDMAAYNQRMTSETMERDQIQKNLDRLNSLQQEEKTAKNAYDRDLIYQEILSFLEEQRIPGITALGQQYQNALSQKETLIAQNYALDNPRMKEISTTLQGLQQKIKERVTEYLSEQNNRYRQLVRNIGVSEQRLRQSPRKEIQLARLQRNREAKAQIYSDLLVRYSEVKVADVSIAPDAELLQQAEVPVMLPSIKDQIKKLAVFGFGPILGLVIAIGLFVGLDFLKHKARSEKDLENLLNLPVLSSVPLINSDKETVRDFNEGKRMDSRLVTIDFTPTPASNAFRALRTRLVLGHEEEQQNLIFSSLMPNEGKSLVVANLAITFAQLKKPTLLIDADLRRGVLHNSFLSRKKPGLTDILASPEPMTVEFLSRIIQKTTIPNLHLISCGKEVPNPTELIMDQRMEQVFQQLKQRFQYIVFDTPPLGMIPDAAVLNKIVHNLVLVIRYGKTDTAKLKKEIESLEDMKADIRGVIFNGIKESKKQGYYNYSYYKY